MRKIARWLAAGALCMPAWAASAGGIEFQPCDLLDAAGIPRVEAECARYSVAENRAEPGGRQLSLRIARVKARIAGARQDPVIFLAGGPGQAAVDAYVSVQGGLARINRNRDILLIDQRGTGGSNRLACALPDPEQTLTADRQAWRRLAQECLDKLSPIADLRHYTTSDYIDDLEDIRAALGIAQVNLVGGSYGTRVALEYLRRHPTVVRSVVVDGVVPPGLALGADHARNLEVALTNIFAACTANAECRERHGEPMAQLKRLRAELDRAPRKVDFRDPTAFTDKTGTLTHDVLAAIVRLYSYKPESAALLPLWIAEALRGNAAPLYAQIELLSRHLEEQLAHGMELSVLCSEDAAALRADPRDAQTLLGSGLVDGLLAQCDMWPRGRVPADFKQPLKSDKPVLILSGENDPVTPPRYGEQVLATLSAARHIQAPGQGHITMNSGCIPRLLEKFVETADAAALDASCVEHLGALPAFLDYNGFGP
ncbi:MAG TPA: alpha/beta fold hydrolase [Fontimonas sp.]